MPQPQYRPVQGHAPSISPRFGVVRAALQHSHATHATHASRGQWARKAAHDTRPPNYPSIHPNHAHLRLYGTDVWHNTAALPTSMDENYLDLLAVVGALNLQLYNVSLDQLNSKYGITEPVWYGVGITVAYLCAYYLQWASILDALACKWLAIRYRTRPAMWSSTILLGTGVIAFLIMFGLATHPFYFGLYPEIAEDTMQDGKYSAMFWANVIPTGLFVVSFPVWIGIQVRQHSKRYGQRQVLAA